MDDDLNSFLIMYKTDVLHKMRIIMPATTPPIGHAAEMQLEDIGRRIRAQRKRLRVSATVAAEAAGLSRVTLHRIERGAASVGMGAYLNAVSALGLQLVVREPQDRARGAPNEDAAALLPAAVRLADFAQLRRLAWHLGDATELTPREALDLYERNWRHVDPDRMEDKERSLVNTLARELGGGRLLV